MRSVVDLSRVFSVTLIRFRPVLFSLTKMRCSVWVMSPVICLSNCYEPSDSSTHVTLPCSQMAREGPHSAAARICLFKTNGTVEFTSRVHKQSGCSQKYLTFSDKLPQQSLSILAFITFVNAGNKTKSISLRLHSHMSESTNPLRDGIYDVWKYSS